MENTPLLVQEAEIVSEASHNEHTPLLSTPCPDQPKSEQHPQYVFVVTIIVLSFFLISVGEYLASAPYLQIVEKIICQSHFRSSERGRFAPLETIPEEWCKGADVQGKLAMVNGWATTFDAVPGIIMAIPFGAMADKHGRKPVLSLSLFGACLSQLWIIVVGK